jgi:hypothetical protein
MLSNFSLVIRDQIHRENMMFYANLKDIGGQDTADPTDAGLPASDLKVEAQGLQDSVSEIVAKTTVGDSSADCNELSGISTGIRDRIHKENIRAYACLASTRQQSAKSLQDIQLAAAAVETTTDSSGIESSSAEKLGGGSYEKMSMLSRRISNRIHKENLHSYAKFKNKDFQSAQRHAESSFFELKLEDYLNMTRNLSDSSLSTDVPEDLSE